MSFLCGEYKHQLDEKGRVRIPSCLKKFLDGNNIIFKGLGGCLFIYSGKSFEEIAEKFKAIPLTDIAAQTALSKLFASIYQLEEDGQGRTLIPQPLREALKLKKNVVFVGALNRIELWDEASYGKRGTNDANGGLEVAAAALKDYGI